MTTLNILCAGAANGLVRALQERFFAETGATVQGQFGAVGAMKEALLAGAACDVMIVTAAMIDSLVGDGRLRGNTVAALGRVRTGIAVRSGQPHPDVSTPQALKAALLAADAIHFPDPERATAGIHFANVLRQLEIHDTVLARFRTYPNGATAMRELAASTAPNPIGCTQVTEINYTDGVDLVGPLPERFELVTVYSAATNTKSAQPELAARFIELLAGPASHAVRAVGGFED